MSWRRRIVIIIAALTLVLTSLLLYLFGSRHGGLWLTELVTGQLDIKLQQQQWRGNLWEGLSVDHLQLSNHSTGPKAWQNIKCQRCEFRWQPLKLLRLKLSIDTINLTNLAITLEKSAPEENEKNNDEKFVFPILPITVDLKRLHIQDLKLIGLGSETITLKKLQGKAALLQQKLSINIVQGQYLQWPLKGSATINFKDAIDGQASLFLPWDKRLQASTKPSKVVDAPVALSFFCREVSPIQCTGLLNWKNIDWNTRDWNSLQGVTSNNDDALTLDSSAGELQWAINDTAIDANLVNALKINNGDNNSVKITANLDLHNKTVNLPKWKIQRQKVSMSGSTLVSWLDKINISSDFNFSNVARSTLEPFVSLTMLPEDLILNSRGQLDIQLPDSAQPSTAQLKLSALSLATDKHQLAGSGNFNWKNCGVNHCWQLSNFNLKNNNTFIKADINAINGAPKKADIQLQGQNIETWLPEIRGDINSNISIENSHLMFNFSSQKLQWQQWRIENTSTKAAATIDPNKKADQWNWLNIALQTQLFESNLSDGTQTDKNLGAIAFQGKGNADLHKLNLSVTPAVDADALSNGLLKALTISSSGQWQSDDNDWRWSNTFNSIKLVPNQGKSWHLKKSSRVDISNNQQSWQPLCLVAQDSATSLCVEAGKLQNGIGDIEVALDRWSLSREQSPTPQFYRTLADSWKLQGDAYAKATMTLAKTDMKASGYIFSDDINLNFSSDDNILDFPLAPARVDWQWMNKNPSQLFSWQALLHGSGDDTISSKGSYAIHDNTLQANINGYWSNLQTLQPLLPDVDRIKGIVNLDFKINGPIQQPIIVGSANIKDLSLYIPESGTDLKEWQIQIDSDIKNMSLRGQGKVGEGPTEIIGTMTQVADDTNKTSNHIQVAINGQDMKLINTKTLKLQSDSRLNLAGSTQGLHLSGDIKIKNSLLELEQLPVSSIRVSPDQEIIGLTHSNKKDSVIPFTADIRLLLDKSVRFKGFGLETDLHGELRLQQTEKQPPQAQGVINLDNGFYKRYSQRLEIKQGQIFFTGELDNPTLKVRAEREFKDAIVGLELSGSASSPESRLYSTPAMTDANRLSYLISGKPMSDAGQGASNELQNAAIGLGLSQAMPTIDNFGQKIGLSNIALENDTDNTTAIALGKQLNEQLYIKYVYGLINNSARLVMEYRLNRNISLETSSGENQAFDLRYRWHSQQPERLAD